MTHPIGIRDPMLDCELDEAFAVAARIGFDCIELDVGAYRDHPLYEPAPRGRLAEQARAAGVEIASVCLGAFWNLPPASPDEAVRREAADLLERTIDICAEVGVATILAPLTENESTKNEPLEVQRERWVEMLRAAGSRADDRGVAIGLEACNRKFARGADQVIELAERSGARSLGAYYDPGNAVGAGLNPAEEIRQLGDRLKAFHVKDSKGQPLGEGGVDFSAVTAALKANGYSGPLILETPGGDDPQASAARNLEITRRLFNG